MNFSQYIIVIMIVQTVRSNTIMGRDPQEDPRTDDSNIDSKVGVLLNGDKRDFAAKRGGLIVRDVTNEPSNDTMASSELLESISSPKFSLQRIRRTPGSKSRRKKKKCDPGQQNCKRNRRRKGSRKGRKCKKGRKGKKGRKRCKKTTKSPPIKFPIPSPNSTSPGFLQTCIRSSTDCGPGHCCARHHYNKICKPEKKEGEPCKRPTRKNRRDIDHYEWCGCESHLVCKKNKKSRQFTCQPKT